MEQAHSSGNDMGGRYRHRNNNPTSGPGSGARVERTRTIPGEEENHEGRQRRAQTNQVQMAKYYGRIPAKGWPKLNNSGTIGVIADVKERDGLAVNHWQGRWRIMLASVRLRQS